MNSTPELYMHLNRLFQTTAQWIGLQRTAGPILVTLYIQSCEDNSGLSVSDISKKTGLSLSTVSSICSQLDTLGIIMKQSVEQQNGRGRRRSVLTLRVGIDGLLRLGMTRHLEEASRILDDIERVMVKNGIEPTNSIQRALGELTLFIATPFTTK